MNANRVSKNTFLSAINIYMKTSEVFRIALSRPRSYAYSVLEYIFPLLLKWKSECLCSDGSPTYHKILMQTCFIEGQYWWNNALLRHGKQHRITVKPVARKINWLMSYESYSRQVNFKGRIWIALKAETYQLGPVSRIETLMALISVKANWDLQRL